MSSYGQIISYVYTSAGRLPIQDAVTLITQIDADGNNELINTQITDRNGKTAAVSLETPDIEESLSPGSVQPFALVTMTVEYPGYEQIRVENVQVFPQRTTVQEFQLIPLTQSPDLFTPSETFRIPLQNL